MYRLFSRIPKGLEPVADIFKKHVEGEGTKLVLQVTEALNNKKEKEAGACAVFLPFSTSTGQAQACGSVIRSHSARWVECMPGACHGSSEQQHAICFPQESMGA